MKIKFHHWLTSMLGLVLLLPVAHAQDQQYYPETQGWGQSQMRAWYELSQGSRLIPLDWLNAVQNNDGTPFFSRKAMEAFGYAYFVDRPESLPIGFIIDRDPSKAWLGFNCSACHTSQLKAGTASVFVHGGQSMADFQAFTTRLIANMGQVLDDDKTFAIFAQQVLGEAATATEKDQLKLEVAAWLDHQ
jgi:hypothetical protein